MNMRIAAIIFSIFLPMFCFSQDNNLSADELLIEAKKQAFTHKNYPKAISILKQAIDKSPNYTDLHVFLGRIYTWSDNVDSAKVVFENLYTKQVDDEDFYLAYGYLLYWNEDNSKAKSIINEGLHIHPTSEDLLLLQAKFNYSINAYSEAENAVQKLLNINPKHTEANALSQSIKSYTTKNAISISYDFSHFDKQFEDNWHIVGLSYKRTTPIGSVIFKTNYANKFADNGVQFELEAYPRINKTFYMYVGAGYSENVGIFPHYRTGASLYANLPQSFEGEIGFRQLNFSSSIWMYTASIGKYYQNLWFNLRTYLSPDRSNVSHSYTGTVRYYTKGANDYLGFQVGTGISPEESLNTLLELNTFKLKTYKVGVIYNLSLRKHNLFNTTVTYFNQEYQLNKKGNQYDFSIGYSRIF